MCKVQPKINSNIGILGYQLLLTWTDLKNTKSTDVKSKQSYQVDMLYLCYNVQKGRDTIQQYQYNHHKKQEPNLDSMDLVS
jgi:hypothetical protein